MSEPDVTRVVADADVLAADLLVGGAARRALDHVRRHSWVTLVASEPLLEEARAVVAALADPALADDWRETVTAAADIVEHPPEDHPALASAYRSGAAHVLSFDPELTSARAGAALRRASVSVKRPDAFDRLFDPESLYPTLFDEPYPGPDADPRGRP
jgi:predicted nucleic acid-binding protein